MSSSLLPEMLFPKQSTRALGVAVGLVTNNQDPDGLGRVKVKYPWLGDDDESYWARLVVPMAGNDRGTWFLPEVDDEVLIAFEQGSLDYPYVLGALWNGKDKPPESNSDGKNNHRTIKSRSGHIIRMDDTDGSEKLEIIDKTGKNKVVLDSSQNSVTIEAGGDIKLTANGKLVLSGNGVELKSQANGSFKASGNLDVNANGQLTLKGSMININ
ncbi:MAG TPA: phage baseplate assembly protein V [Bryocella sp.]|nr:phage baseplate assembly protein V [Bryocella sp.]